MAEEILKPFGTGTFNEASPPGTVPGRDDHDPQYDRLFLNSALTPANERVLFTQSVRSMRDGRVLTYADTNNDYGDRIPDTRRYTYYWLSAYIMLNPAQASEDALEAMYDLIRETHVTFVINNLKATFTQPLWKFFGAVQGFAIPTVSNIQWPNPTYSGQWMLRKPIVLAAGTQSYLSVSLPGGTSPAILNGSAIGFEFDARREMQQ